VPGVTSQIELSRECGATTGLAHRPAYLPNVLHDQVEAQVVGRGVGEGVGAVVQKQLTVLSELQEGQEGQERGKEGGQQEGGDGRAAACAGRTASAGGAASYPTAALAVLAQAHPNHGASLLLPAPSCQSSGTAQIQTNWKWEAERRQTGRGSSWRSRGAGEGLHRWGDEQAHSPLPPLWGVERSFPPAPSCICPHCPCPPLCQHGTLIRASGKLPLLFWQPAPNPTPHNTAPRLSHVTPHHPRAHPHRSLVKAASVVLPAVEGPGSALGHAQEGGGGRDVHRVGAHLVPVLCTAGTTGGAGRGQEG